MKTVKIIKIKDEYVLPIPKAFVKLYSLEKGRLFNLEIKESESTHKIILFTYATELS